MTLGDLGLGNERDMVRNQREWIWAGNLHCARSLFFLPFWQYAYWADGFLLHILYRQHALMSCMNLFLL
jgi:hypothetical protein